MLDFLGKVHEAYCTFFVVLRFCVDTIYRPDPKQIIHKLYREQLTSGKWRRVYIEVHSVLIMQLDLQFY